jgi:hypothetical protein
VYVRQLAEQEFRERQHVASLAERIARQDAGAHDRDMARTVEGRRKTVSTWAKSIARIAWVCAARNCRQVGPDRRGAGSMSAVVRIFQTVEAAIRWPSPTSSP